MASVGLSFLKVLENPGSKNLEGNDDVYVHPMVKRSASALSTKSLEMCTESLGSETGSESGDEFCVISLEERERLRGIQKSKCRNFDRKVRRNDFPPPLTSISGSHGAAVKVMQHREGGRLVIKAVSYSNCATHFQAERTNGRLKLSLLRDRFVNYESERVEIKNYESGRVEIGNYESGRVEIENYEEGGEKELDEEEVVAEEEEEGGWRWDMDGNRWRMAGKGDSKMVTRCKECGNGNKVFTNWRSSLVAIS
ncbi:hypothetical protein L1987_82896 [Smallanthus sonchifolius]|uniref:Uncharacterized protein n=1 Tax=Smallanthus sonchifolius TaxID=185202 RepID=A0ACB8YAM2_9ASTR|nr:hypothetical protein L1987_82896 [Smallanthus sonchifolius]